VEQPSRRSHNSGEFIPPVQQQSASETHGLDDKAYAVERRYTVSASELRCMSREQVLCLLARQQDEISRREEQLSNVNSGSNKLISSIFVMSVDND